jgi:ubiquitin carboxyl-terminal hydrolase 34
LTAFLLVIDVRNLSHGPVTEESLADLMCINYLRTLAGFPHPEDPYLANGVERNLHPLDPFVIFQSSQGCSLGVLVSFMEYHTTILSQYPRKVMDHLTPSCYLVHAIVRDSLSTQGTLERSRTNLALGYKCFSLLSNAIDMVIEKTINSLSHDNAQHLIQYSSLILKYSLQGSHPEAMQRVQQYRQEHPQVPYLYTVQAIALEWRFQLYCKLIRSRQMQLRVSAAERMCDDLVVEWKRYQDRQQESLEDTQPNLEYLHYLSDFLMRTGIVDYILGPTCHPEITATSFNIVGFLGVTKTYTAAQTDLLWQTLTSTQDPRIAEALVRMMVRVTPLIQHGDLTFLLDKFRHISVDSFTPIMRDLFDNVTDLVIKFPLPQPQPPPLASYEVCVRLLRESSVFTAQGSIAYPEVYQFTQLKLKRLLMAGPTEEGRRNIALSCLNDVASRSATSSGSLQVLSIISTTNVALRTLIEEHNFIPLLIEDFEIAAQFAQTVGVAKVYSNPFCQARRKFISSIITHFGSAIDSELGQRLWDYLVGDKAVSPDDRKAAWDDLNQALQTLKRKRLDSQFLTDCLQLFLPKLPPSCYCSGSLAFVREVLVPAANDINGIILDDEESLQPAGIELLWQIILTAPSQTIADGAILTLVNEIYVDSKSILSYPLQRARKVHFSLVHRCLSQLKSAAQSLTAFNNGATSNGDEKMMIEVNDDERIEQELRFTRTLKVLTTLSSTLQTKSHFAAPDLRSLMLSSPNAVDGDSADLKYQSFDRDEQTQVRPLKIGLRNSAASLLASLREATGFENYRLYFRGTTLAPSQADICKSLAELNIKNGLILVKRELDLVSSPVRIKPGASPLEIEILSHFNDLWEYLSMEEKLAREVIGS